MVYRRHARELEEPQGDGPLMVVDASGRHGRGGQDGGRGSDGSGRGAHGGRGGDAGPAERGQDAGMVLVRLEPSGDDTVFVTGQLVHAQGERRQVRKEVRFGERGDLVFAAVGGDGGAGGDGGRGGHGAKGRDGRDATRYSSGSNGGRGGDGGDGGDGSNGAPGGHGGQVVVEVDDEASHLLMLVSHTIEAGTGGPAGTNGSGGYGGSGGDGGSSYSWTTTESYTDSEGNRRTRSKSHYNPGGSDGPPGSSGRPGMATLHGGPSGSRGRFTIHVKHQDQIAQYPARYDLQLVSFTHRSRNHDGIYEPQEEVLVEKIAVKNVGGMPTPGHCDVELRLQQAGWVLPHDMSLPVPRRLAPGQTHVFETEALVFRIGDFLPEGPDAPLARPETVRHRADLPLVARGFQGYEGTVSDEQGVFVIRFPIEAGDIESLHSLPPGQAARMRFEIGNVSRQAFGRNSPCKRRIRFRLQGWESELGDEHAVLLGPGDVKLSIDDGYVVEIDHLDAGESRSFEVTLGMKKSAPFYESVRLLLTLELGQIDLPDRLRPIQYRSFQTRVAQRYRHDPDADLLLVVHHRTTREELMSWRALADELGFTFCVWDISLERGLPLHQPIEGWSLTEAFAGKTVIVLDDVIETPIGHAAAHHLVDAQEVFDAMQRGVSFAFTGQKLKVNHWLVSTGDEPESLADNQALVKRSEEAPPAPSEAEVFKWSFFGSVPPHTWLKKRARLLSRLLASRYPQLRFCIVEAYDAEVVDRFLWMKKYRVGRLRIIPTLPAAAGRLINTEVETEARQQPAYIGGRQNLRTLMLTRSFDEKLARLDQILSDRPSHQLVPRILEGLLADLANEQTALLQRRGPLSGAVLREATPHLNRLAEQVWLAEGGPDGPAGQAIIELVATLRFGGRSRWRWWEWPLYPFRRAPALSRWTHAQSQRVLEHFFLRGMDDWDDDLERAVALELDRVHKKLKHAYECHCQEAGVEGSEAFLEVFAAERMQRALLEDGITTDAEVLDHYTERVYSELGYSRIEKGRRRDRKQRGKLRRAGEAAEAALLRPLPDD